ncbi:uncharacterized protein L201_006241 [Kwoniella dendrophila CBS 6074]|uniref:Rhomboid-type serine protease n=1 Tax=Kwoniella dendrophila CBS 6074 TaxID=1295534 RepID=A0AAX4K297_9TREE
MPIPGPRPNPSGHVSANVNTNFASMPDPQPTGYKQDYAYGSEASFPNYQYNEAQEPMRNHRADRSQPGYDDRFDDGDVGLLGPSSSRIGDNNNHSNRYEYNNPYEERDDFNDHDHDNDINQEQQQPRSISPSLGPWDSASQRSLPYHYNQRNLQTSNHPHSSLAPGHTSINGVEGNHSNSHNSKPSGTGGLSYIDEEGEYYRTDKNRPASTSGMLTNQERERDQVEMGLIGNTNQHSYGGMTNSNPYSYELNEYSKYEDSPYPYPSKNKDNPNGGIPLRGTNNLYDYLLFPTGLDRLLALFDVNFGQYPIEQAIERKRRGLGGQRYPIAAWCLTIVMTSLMVYELVANYQAMGSPIATKPTFNPMIGPSSEVLINIGARFPPCMKYVEALPPTFSLACLNDTSSTPTTQCSIEEICGHGGFHGENPDQSWRFVYPIFLHVGIVHLILNMLAQITAAAQVEREMGTLPFLIVYLAGGIYGFVLGGNFSRTGIPSVGASGALFATNACVLVDLVMHWKYEERPKLKAFLLAIEFLIGFGIGYIPNAVDGLAHLGGWAIGILLGIILYPSISETKRHKYILWVARVIAFVLAILAFVLTIKNFYTDDPNANCEWCRYLSCIPTNSNEHCKGTGITVTNTTTTKRSWDLL